MTFPVSQLAITSLSTKGDGIARLDQKNIFIPLTCPGDTITARITRTTPTHDFATLDQIIHPSPYRQAAPCLYFGQCGGCKLQHLEAHYYASYKAGILSDLLKRLKVDTSHTLVHPMIQIKERSRRRIDLKISVTKGEVAIGFFSFKSHDVVAIKDCLVTDSKLTELLPALHTLLHSLQKPGYLKSISLTLLDDSIDIICHIQKKLPASDQSLLKHFAETHPIARLELCMQDEPDQALTLYDNGNTTLSLGNVAVAIPSGAFLQATQKGQEAITHFILKHLLPARHVADLYAGCGTYSFPLAAHVTSITAYEGAGTMVQAMHNAIVAHQLTQKITTQVQDLFSRPIQSHLLNRFDAIIINPPRNGASPQIRQLAKSTVAKIAMVSCNPITFERDAATLLNAGYHMTHAVAIDQFYWSGHLELVGVFEK